MFQFQGLFKTTPILHAARIFGYAVGCRRGLSVKLIPDHLFKGEKMGRMGKQYQFDSLLGCLIRFSFNIKMDHVDPMWVWIFQNRITGD